MAGNRTWWKPPEVWVPTVAAAVGTIILVLGWFIGEDQGFSIANGVVSVMGFAVTAFAASAIWAIRRRHLRIIAIREILRRLEGIGGSLERAVADKVAEDAKRSAGRLKAVVSELDLQRFATIDLELVSTTIGELQTTDNRSVLRIVRKLLPHVTELIEQLEMSLFREEVRINE